MAEDQVWGLKPLRRIFAGNEPQGIRAYFVVPEEGRRYHEGTTVPLIGAYTQLGNGLWVPEGVRVSPAPLDYAFTYLTLSEISSDADVGLDQLVLALRRLPLKHSILQIAATMAAIRQPNNANALRSLDRNSLAFFAEPARSRLASKMAAGSILHAPQLLMVLTKLILANCPDSVPEDQALSVTLPFLLLVVADSLDASFRGEAETSSSIPLLSELSVELVANNNFNASYRADSQMALFQRRWIEMSHESHSSFLSEPLDEVYARATGVRLQDMAAIAIALWSSCVNERQPIVNCRTYLSPLGWEPERVERLLSYIALPIDEYRRRIREELEQRSLDWHFTTFALFPLVRFEEDVIVLDPELLLRRCLGFIPFFDIQAGLVAQGRRSEVSAVRRAFDDYSERYVREALESLSGTASPKRVYSDKDLRRADNRRKMADVAVDYGDAWVVVEVTTHQASRDTVNAVSVSGLIRDRDALIEEAIQVQSTIDLIRQDQTALTGGPRESRVTFFPIIVLTEGFPNNPLVTSIVREELKSRNLLIAPDIAPLELIDVVELDMVEGVAETGGPTLPEILRLKAASNFHADSLGNFLIADARFSPKRPQRVADAFRRMFSEVVVALQGDPQLFE